MTVKARKKDIKIRYLVFDASNGTVVTPVKISRKIASRKDRRLVSIRRQPKPSLQSKELAAEFFGSKIREFSDAMGSGRVHYLVFLGTEEISFENTKSVIMFLLSRIIFAEFGLESGEMMLCVEEMILAL